MLWANAAKHLMLDAMDESIATGAKYISEHTAYSATGTNEVTGGSPAYARKAATWAAAASGAKAISASVTFDIPASTTVAWLGLWDASTAGTFLAMIPRGGTTPKAFAMDDSTADVFKSSAHGYSNGDQVVFWGSALPTGVSVGTIYYIVTSTTDTFQVSATSGGSAVNVTAKGQGHVQKIVTETFTGQGTDTVSALSVDLGALA